LIDGRFYKHDPSGDVPKTLRLAIFKKLNTIIGKVMTKSAAGAITSALLSCVEIKVSSHDSLLAVVTTPSLDTYHVYKEMENIKNITIMRNVFLITIIIILNFYSKLSAHKHYEH
jgi:hypothetical protein